MAQYADFARAVYPIAPPVKSVLFEAPVHFITRIQQMLGNTIDPNRTIPGASDALTLEFSTKFAPTHAIAISQNVDKPAKKGWTPAEGT
jgi:hypothetical protein